MNALGSTAGPGLSSSLGRDEGRGREGERHTKGGVWGCIQPVHLRETCRCKALWDTRGLAGLCWVAKREIAILGKRDKTKAEETQINPFQTIMRSELFLYVPSNDAKYILHMFLFKIVG